MVIFCVVLVLDTVKKVKSFSYSNSKIYKNLLVLVIVLVVHIKKSFIVLVIF